MFLCTDSRRQEERGGGGGGGEGGGEGEGEGEEGKEFSPQEKLYYGKAVEYYVKGKQVGVGV